VVVVRKYLSGQGATEYLVLLAVVLIIALVAIALLGFFPGLSSDAKINQSASYWKAASPFAITAHSITTAGNATLVLQNTAADGTYTLTNISLAGNATSGSYSFSPGETRSISVGAPTGTAGTAYDLAVNITYTTPYGISSKQYGSKTLVGKYI
jgi:uncharacterized protein (UPF0333 family)